MIIKNHQKARNLVCWRLILGEYGMFSKTGFGPPLTFSYKLIRNFFMWRRKNACAMISKSIKTSRWSMLKLLEIMTEEPKVLNDDSFFVRTFEEDDQKPSIWIETYGNWSSMRSGRCFYWKGWKEELTIIPFLVTVRKSYAKNPIETSQVSED